jgi:hypothetical protein
MSVGVAMLCVAPVTWADHGGQDHGNDDVVTYSVATIDYPGFRGTTTVNGVSDSERVVGAFTAPATQFGYGFLEFHGQFSLLPSGPCRSAHCDTTPLAVNSSGEIAGEFSEDPTHRSVFVIHGPLLLMIPVPSTRNLAILGGLNERGDVVGFFQTNAGPIRTFLYGGLLTSVLAVPAGFTDMAGRAINNSGQITGSVDDSKGLHGFAVTRGKFSRFDFPGGLNTSPVAINNPGDVVGTYNLASSSPTPVQHGFLMVRGGFTRVDFPGGLNTMPSALNDSDVVVGTYENPAIRPPFNTSAFVYQRGKFTRLPLPGAVENVGGISSSGIIVGTYFDAGCPVSCSVHGFTATPSKH